MGATPAARKPLRGADLPASNTTTETETTTSHAALRAAASKPCPATPAFQLEATAPATRKPAPDPRVKVLLDRFVAAFSAEFGRAPVMTGHARLGSQARDLLRALDLAGEEDALGALEGLFSAYFQLARRDRFYSGAPLSKLLDSATVERLRAEVATTPGPSSADLDWERAAAAGGAWVRP